MAIKNSRSFGCSCQQPTQCPTHGGVTVQDWMHYIDSYMDVRARQIYDKLRAMVLNGNGSSSSDGTLIKDAIYIKDAATEKIYKVYIEDGNICHEEVSIEDIPGGEGQGGCNCCDHDIIINNYIEGAGGCECEPLEFEDLSGDESVRKAKQMVLLRSKKV